MQMQSKVREFANFNPFVNMLYFILVIGFSVFFMNPVFLFVSLILSVAYAILLKGKKAVYFDLIVLVPVIVLTSLLNPAFNHEGNTILMYLPSGNPLTLESIVYGAASGTMLAAVISWFSCFNEVMTGDKFVYLFGKITPSMSLILSMILRFVPKFKKQFVAVVTSQKNIGRSIYSGKLLNRGKCVITIISVMITWALENAVDTADSMKSRGYGICKRSAFEIFKVDLRDKIALCFLSLTTVFIVFAVYSGKIYCNYFPVVNVKIDSVIGVVAVAAYFMLCAMPLWIEVWEMTKWKR